jgi:hypothetical protein
VVLRTWVAPGFFLYLWQSSINGTGLVPSSLAQEPLDAPLPSAAVGDSGLRVRPRAILVGTWASHRWYGLSFTACRRILGIEPAQISLGVAL